MIKRILALLLLAALFAAPAWADTTTVSSTADLEGALANELFDTINIAPGTYSGRFTITRPVKLIGDGSSKPILDGGALGTVLTITGAEVTLRNIIVQNGRAQYGAALNTSGGANVTAEGCVFRNNYGSGESQYSFVYGAVRVQSNCTMTLTDCEFTGNTVVAGIGSAFYSTGMATLTNCSFTNNSGKTLHLEHNNTSRSDGAAAFDGGTAVLTDCSFINNSCEGRSAGVDIGAVNSIVLQGCEFRNNRGNFGVALGISVYSNNVTVTDCDFIGNKNIEEGTAEAGAVRCYAKTLFRNCAFVDNGGEKCQYGGAVYFNDEGCDSTLINCLFTGNSALDAGEYEYDPRGIGGAFYAYNSGYGFEDRTLTFIHCTLVGNDAVSGGEVMYDNVPTRFVNCVIWHAGDDIYQRKWYELSEPPVTFDNCAVSPSILATESILSCELVNDRGSKIISGGTPTRVTYTRPNGHSVELVQTVSVTLEDASETMTGKSLSAIVSEYNVEQSTIETDLTARERSAAAPELGAVNSGEVNPPAPPQVNPPVITSFRVEGVSDGTMTAGRNYKATATATGEGVSWTVESDAALTCSRPKAGNSTTFTITANAESTGAEVSLRAQNEGGATEPAVLTFNVVPERDEKDEKADEMRVDPQAVDPQGLNVTADEIVKTDMTLADLNGDLRNAVSNNSTTPLAVLPEIQPQQNGTYYIKVPVDTERTGDLRFFPGGDSSASDADAVFYDENWNEITSVDSSVVIIIVAAPLEAGKTYTPVVAAEDPDNPQPPAPDHGSHNSGCNGGFGILSLLPLLGLFVLKKK